jgi:hypothetical protein
VKTEPREGRRDRSQTSHAHTSDKNKWRYAIWLFGTNSLKKGAMWRIDPLLGKDFEKHDTTTDAMQRRRKHATTTVFSTRSVQMGYKEDNWGYPVS